MKDYLLNNSNSEDNLKDIKDLLKENSQLELRQIIINYNTKGLPPEEQLDLWPVKLEFVNNDKSSKDRFIIVNIYNFAVGYNGQSPNNLIEMLDFFGVRYNPDDILTEQCVNDQGCIYLHYVQGRNF